MGTFKIPLASIATRMLPHHWPSLIRSRQTRSKRARNDAQLALYSKILESGFLHYGYFELPANEPDDISLRDLKVAQHRYAEILLEFVTQVESPALDVGCGIGGMSQMMRERSLLVSALTPDRRQVDFIQERYPELAVLHCKYEELADASYVNHFGTILMSESFQYINLARAFALTRTILKPGGRWIICDYFRRSGAGEKSGHAYADFLQTTEAYHDFEVIENRDITPNVLPTLAFAEHIGNALGVPLMEFAEEKLKAKRPRLHYLFRDIIAQLHRSMASAMLTVSPSEFQSAKEYRLLVLQKRG